MQYFRLANILDTASIVQLVNAAYRGESSRAGWTTEADLLDGLRTGTEEVKRLIEAEHAMLLLCLDGDDLIGTVCIEREQHTAHIGMFVVQPTLQGNGIGKRLLAEAEKLAQQTWRVQKLQMQVITQRHELIAFYERNGYQRTGAVCEFPVNPAMWQPKVTGLQLALLEKPSTFS